jgi:hypothetical protein
MTIGERELLQAKVLFPLKSIILREYDPFPKRARAVHLRLPKQNIRATPRNYAALVRATDPRLHLFFSPSIESHSDRLALTGIPRHSRCQMTARVN